jgi:P4 family phage/plasmid primase-like protien
MNAPKRLKESKHWILRRGKLPVNTSGTSSGWTSPSFWMTFDEALDAWADNTDKADGIGYVVARDPLLGDNQIIGGDFDCCRDPVTGVTSDSVEAALKSLNCPTGISPSGTGFRFFCQGKLPDGINKVLGNLPDDLPEDAKQHIIDAKPGINDKLALSESVWNGVEIYEDGPRHLTVPGTWLPEYPLELENRAQQLLAFINPLIEAKKHVEKEKDKKSIGPEKGKGSGLPHLNITDVIDTKGFTQSGDELTGPHPVFGSASGNNLHINPIKNIWYCFHAGSECGGDAWLWIAAISGAIRWEDCASGALRNPSVIKNIKQYVLNKKYLPEVVLFPERAKVIEAIQYINGISASVLEKPSCILDTENIDRLALIKQHDEAEYIRIKTWLKVAKVNIKDMEKLIALKLKEQPDIDRQQDGGYITWDDDGRPVLHFTNLVNDIIKDLHVHVVTGTKKDIALYKNDFGTYEIGDAVGRKLKSELNKRIRASGDYDLDTLTMHMYSKFDLTISTDSPEIGELEQYPYLLCVGNGVVDLRTAELSLYNPKYFMVEKTSHKYDPDKSWIEQAPNWYNSLMYTFDGDRERIEYFQRVMGYCATGETRSDAIFLLYGIGGTGKSTMVDACRNALSNSSLTSGYVRSLKADLQNSKSSGSTIRDGIARAKYARMLLVKELDENNDVSWSTLKELCSTSSVTEARKLYGGTENIRLKCKLVFDTNHLPKCETPDNSILRRLKIIPFKHRFTNKDENTFSNLEAEADGILAWIIEGACKYYASGLGNPAFLQDAISSYKSEMDANLADAWLDQWEYEVNTLIDVQSSELWIPKKELYESYSKFARERGVPPLSEIKFNKFIVAKTGAKKQQMTRTGPTGNKERDTFWLNLIRKK